MLFQKRRKPKQEKHAAPADKNEGGRGGEGTKNLAFFQIMQFVMCVCVCVDILFSFLLWLVCVWVCDPARVSLAYGYRVFGEVLWLKRVEL